MSALREKLLARAKERKLLSIYYTAGFPSLSATVQIGVELEKAGVDLIEVGFPFSDSLVDGPTIQVSNEAALKNGMTLKIYFEQLKELRSKVSFPIIAMTAFNPVLKMGVESFVMQCAACGVDGVIIPDLPFGEYITKYRSVFGQYSIANILLLTSRSDDSRIKEIDTHSDGFVYAVSSDATTGGALESGGALDSYLKRIGAMKLKNPVLVGFGIHDKKSFAVAIQHTHGGIIGSAFIKALQESGTTSAKISEFIGPIRG